MPPPKVLRSKRRRQIKQKTKQAEVKVVNEVKATEQKATEQKANLPDQQKQTIKVAEQNEKPSRKVKAEYEPDKPGSTPRHRSLKQPVADGANANTEPEDSAATSKRSQIVTEKFIFES
ncbi:hypothetical protein M3Y94_00872600 [Aphelenchoides besseyi]|nr:hypothetical protein M3Y94_00872600 [Aphelenchoides besseyi]